MKNLYLLLLLALSAATSCQQKRHSFKDKIIEPKRLINVGPCSCNVVSGFSDGDWMLEADKDSVVICNPGRINHEGREHYSSYTALFQKHVLAQDYEKIFFCGTGEQVPSFAYGGYGLSYGNKKLVIDWQVGVDSFLVSKNQWSSEKDMVYVRNAYRQLIYAQNGKLYVGPKKIVYLAQKLTALAIRSVDVSYALETAKKQNYYKIKLGRKLFALAMAGHKLSQTRLLGLQDPDVSSTGGMTTLENYKNLLRMKLAEK